jgi:hypothetical protein
MAYQPENRSLYHGKDEGAKLVVVYLNGFKT